MGAPHTWIQPQDLLNFSESPSFVRHGLRGAPRRGLSPACPHPSPRWLPVSWSPAGGPGTCCHSPSELGQGRWLNYSVGVPRDRSRACCGPCAVEMTKTGHGLTWCPGRLPGCLGGAGSGAALALGAASRVVVGVPGPHSSPGAALLVSLIHQHLTALSGESTSLLGRPCSPQGPQELLVPPLVTEARAAPRCGLGVAGASGPVLCLTGELPRRPDAGGRTERRRPGRVLGACAQGTVRPRAGLRP